MNLLSAMSQRVRSSLTTIMVMLVAGALALIGLVWISIWAVGELRFEVGDWARLLVGLLLFIPLVVIVLARALRAPAAPPLPPPEPERAPLMLEAAPDLTAAAKAFVQRSPLTALALGAIAGLMLSRSSGAVSRLLDALDDPRER